MTLPRLALRLHGGVEPRRCVELAAAAERAGLATVWFAENPFGRGVLPGMAACAVATDRVRLGIGVFNPYNRHPTLIAMEASALDELARGRVILGLGSGIGGRVRQIGQSYDRPIGALRDAVAITRRLLAGDEVSYAGKVFSAQSVRLDHPPARAGIPIYMAAMGDQAIRLCGEVADGLMISNMCAPGFTVRAIALMRAAATATNRTPPAEVVQYVPCAIRDDGAEARRAVRALIGGMLLHYWRHGGEAPAVRAAHLAHTGIEADDFEAAMRRLDAGGASAEVLDDRFVAAYGIAGTVDECLAQCAAYARAGVTELGLSFVGGTPEADLARLADAAGLP